MKYLKHRWPSIFHENIGREIRNGILASSGTVILVLVALAFLIGPHEQDPKSVRSISIDLKCPEDYPDQQSSDDALSNALDAYQSRYPDASQEEILRWRYRFLVAQKCKETLANLQRDGIFTEDDYVKYDGDSQNQ